MAVNHYRQHWKQLLNKPHYLPSPLKSFPYEWQNCWLHTPRERWGTLHNFAANLGMDPYVNKSCFNVDYLIIGSNPLLNMLATLKLLMQKQSVYLVETPKDLIMNDHWNYHSLIETTGTTMSQFIFKMMDIVETYHWSTLIEQLVQKIEEKPLFYIHNTTQDIEDNNFTFPWHIEASHQSWWLQRKDTKHRMWFMDTIYQNIPLVKGQNNKPLEPEISDIRNKQNQAYHQFFLIFQNMIKKHSLAANRFAPPDFLHAKNIVLTSGNNIIKSKPHPDLTGSLMWENMDELGAISPIYTAGCATHIPTTDQEWDIFPFEDIIDLWNTLNTHHNKL